MIVIRIFGGLGNQLFQYAFGKALSLEYKRELIIDKSYFDKENYPFDLHPYYPYKLDNYERIQHSFLSKSLTKYARFVGRKRIYKIANLVIPGKKYPYFMYQRDFSFEKLKGSTFAYLRGYWQKFDLIEKYRSQILNDLDFDTFKEMDNKNYLTKIRSTNSVSLHIRRGDYVNHPTFKGLYSNCSLDYFRRGATKIAERVNNPVFYIFSNDNTWVRENFDIPYETVIIDCDGPDHEHLHLMSQCKHHVISNSTFGWWGAWLDQKENSMTVAPERWFENPKRKNDIHYPQHWIRIDN